MIKVCLTGNIASGKSSVARTWKRLGGLVVDADELARRVVLPGTPAFAAIVREWGPGVLDDSGGLDRAALREIVFSDPAARARLEAIIHPAVGALRDQEIAAARRRGVDILVADIPLLFEVGMEDECDLVVLVDAPAGTRLERLVRHRGLDPDDAGRMMAAQMSPELKRAHAHIVIDNTGSVAELEVRAAEVWNELLRRAAGGGGDA